MTSYVFTPKRNKRYTFLIFPIGLDWDSIKPENALGRVRARTHNEAVKNAVNIGIGGGGSVWAMQYMDLQKGDNDMTVKGD